MGTDFWIAAISKTPSKVNAKFVFLLVQLSFPKYISKSQNASFEVNITKITKHIIPLRIITLNKLHYKGYIRVHKVNVR